MALSFFLTFIYFKLGGKRWIFITLVFIYISGLIMSGSKGGAIAFLIAFFTFAIIVPQYRVKSFAIIGLFLLVFSGYSFISGKYGDTENVSSSARLMQITDTQTFSARSRLFLWGAAFEVWTDNILVGIGRGKLGEVTRLKERAWQLHGTGPRIYPGQEKQKENDYVVSHSTYISFLSETGIIGLLLFISIMATVLYRAVRFLISLDSSSNYYIIMACLGAALTSILAQGIVTNVENYRSLWCLAGMIFAVSYWTDTIKPSSKHKLY
jgi:O-antigen ligase